MLSSSPGRQKMIAIALLTGASAPPGGSGRGVAIGSQSALGLAAAGPDEGEAFAVLVLDEVRVDRGVETRVVKLDRKILALLRGALQPGGADLGAADEDPTAGRVPAGPTTSATMRTF
jgi:hypothetical protein